jgi:hypothetical protein
MDQFVYLGFKTIVFLKFFMPRNTFFIKNNFQMKSFANFYLSYLQLLHYITSFYVNHFLINMNFRKAQILHFILKHDHNFNSHYFF